MTYPGCSLPHAFAVIDDIANEVQQVTCTTCVDNNTTKTGWKPFRGRDAAGSVCTIISHIYLSLECLVRFPVRSDTSEFPETGRVGTNSSESSPVSEFVGRISGSDICQDLVQRTRFRVTVGGRDTNKKEYICTLSARTKKDRDTPFE